MASEIWQQVERSESYLVCSMFEEAKSSASSLLRNHPFQSDILESASMVLLQSLHHLHRTSQILDELKQSFPSVEYIPVRVVLTGVCLQMSETCSSQLGEFLKLFLGKWRFLDGSYVPLSSDSESVIQLHHYLELVHLYVFNFLSDTLNDFDTAISWVHKAQLPEDTRQDILRRLHSAKATALSQPDHNKARSSNSNEVNIREGELRDSVNGKQKALLMLSKRVEPCMWWFRSINLKFGNARVVISNGKIVLASLIFLIYWILRRKRISLKSVIGRQALNLKKAVVDMWLLAFSYQMNPLAAVQSPLRGGQSV